ncbi:hypothetical protein O0235_09250 [Tepidiforma flava]|uniref:Uncharacterized protein n=1 Tax=Tepidiforma flava TaxID=3004094 RepID=A0ABY7M2U9_9CHLR|nr:hypothetical protein [Tepidiforma flava]WBL34979.1 hypothetical protein O0235_09250 [Tepidiforma flava]
MQDIITEEVGPFVAWENWAPLGEVELWAPVEAVEAGPEVVTEALRTAAALLRGEEDPGDGQPRGTAGLEAWAACAGGGYGGGPGGKRLHAGGAAGCPGGWRALPAGRMAAALPAAGEALRRALRGRWRKRRRRSRR